MNTAWVSLQAIDATDIVRKAGFQLPLGDVPGFYSAAWEFGSLKGLDVLVVPESPVNFFSRDEITFPDPCMKYLMLRCSHGGFSGADGVVGELMGVIVDLEKLFRRPGLHTLPLLPESSPKAPAVRRVGMHLNCSVDPGHRSIRAFQLVVDPFQGGLGGPLQPLPSFLQRMPHLVVHGSARIDMEERRSGAYR